jgi:prepilin signal peptidase PulO-like enzyme (type II secretory pathway)
MATILGSIYALVSANIRGNALREAMPFGPFLAIGSVATAALGPVVWSWYFALLS